LTAQLPDFSRVRVLVMGDVMLDRYWHGDTGRISPEAPVPVVRIGDTDDRPGGAGNVAMNIASLGGQAIVMGLVGDDESAEHLQKLLSIDGCQPDLIKVSDCPTITKLRVISRHQQLIRMDFEENFSSSDHSHLLSAFSDRLDEADVVVLSDYGKGTLQNPGEFIHIAREKGKPVIVDPKRLDFVAYRGAMLVTPNMSEFQSVVGACKSDADIVNKGRRLLTEAAIEGLLITRSERGMTLLYRDHPQLHLPTRAREVFDVTGAGDTVVAVTAAAIAAGQTPESAAVLANMAASIAVGKLGTATVTVEELEQTLRPEYLSQRGMVNKQQLGHLVADARQRGERIVMTNGCFDLLHPGHVAYLQEAAELGDRLIVAVNDDDSVRRLKGEYRPVNTLQQRMAVLAGLRSVDWVIPFSEDTPERLICEIRPDVLVKGGDYRPEQIAGYDCVNKAGGEVVVLAYLEGCSTSQLIDQIRSQ